MLIALHGRRRVGKTYLIKNHFSTKKDTIFYYITGMKDGSLLEQLKNFIEEIGETFLYPGARLETKNNWRDAFKVAHSSLKCNT